MAYGRRQSGKSEIGHPNHYLGGNRSGNNPVQLCGFEYHFEVFEFVAEVWYNIFVKFLIYNLKFSMFVNWKLEIEKFKIIEICKKLERG